MVWLDVTDTNGSSLYFEVFRVEQRRGSGGRRVAFSGILGDGLFESPVLVEVGAAVEVTFVDQWLDSRALEAFFCRACRSEVEAALVQAVLPMVRSLGQSVGAVGGLRSDVAEAGAHPGAKLPHPPHPGSQPTLPIGIAEAATGWELHP